MGKPGRTAGKGISQLGLALQDVRSWWHVSLPVLQCFPSLPREEFLDLWSLLSLLLVLDFWTCKYYMSLVPLWEEWAQLGCVSVFSAIFWLSWQKKLRTLTSRYFYTERWHFKQMMNPMTCQWNVLVYLLVKIPAWFQIEIALSHPALQKCLVFQWCFF